MNSRKAWVASLCVFVVLLGASLIYFNTFVVAKRTDAPVSSPTLPSLPSLPTSPQSETPSQQLPVAEPHRQPTAPAGAENDDEWNLVGGTKSISVHYGEQKFEIEDPAAVKKLMAALQVTQVYNSGCKSYAIDRTLNFHRGAKGDFLVYITDEGDGFWTQFPITGNTALMTVEKHFFDTLNQQLSAKAQKPLDMLAEIPVDQNVPQPHHLTRESLAKGLKRVMVDYDVDGRMRHAATEDSARLKALADAMASYNTLPEYDDQREQGPHFYAEAMDGAVLYTSLNYINALGKVASTEKLTKEMNAIPTAYEKREINVFGKNSAVKELAAKAEQLSKIIGAATKIELLQDTFGATSGAVFDDAEVQEVVKSFTFAEVLPRNEKLRPEKLKVRITTADGRAITAAFLDEEGLDGGISTGTPLDIPDYGQIWINSEFKDALAAQQQANFQKRATARALSDFPAFLKQLKSAVVKRPEVETPIPAGAYSSFDFATPEQTQRLIQLLTIDAMKPDPKADCVSLGKKSKCTLQLTALVGHDLQMHFIDNRTAVIDKWGTVEFKGDVLTELNHIADAAKAERNAELHPPEPKQDF